MKHNYLQVLGLMTGTSMDGIDISLVKTNGVDLIRLKENYFHKFEIRLKNLLSEILNQTPNFDPQLRKYLNDLITYEHYKAIKNFNLKEKIDLIGFHGQTIFHNPEQKCSVQLGNPTLLAKLTDNDVVFDFRADDLHFGGHGAPLAPIYHKLIMKQLDLMLPSCILNIGGIANLTYWDGKNLIGFDTGPGNSLMDDFMKKISDNFFDQDGSLASQGIIEITKVERFILNNYFKEKPPKSLDRNFFSGYLEDLINDKLSHSDIMATLVAFTVETIAISLDLLPKKIRNIIITGGGYRNSYLMKRLKQRIDINFIDEESIDIDFDFIESELIAFLSARSFYNLPITYPSTTGTSKPTIGGKIYKNL